MEELMNIDAQSVHDKTQAVLASEKGTKGQERRRYKRRVARWDATLITQSKKVLKGRTRDISERGASIATSENLATNTMVVIQLSSYYEGTCREFRIIGQVKHSAVSKDGFVLGIFFKEACEDTNAFLRKFSEKLI